MTWLKKEYLKEGSKTMNRFWWKFQWMLTLFSLNEILPKSLKKVFFSIFYLKSDLLKTY